MQSWIPKLFATVTSAKIGSLNLWKLAEFDKVNDRTGRICQDKFLKNSGKQPKVCNNSGSMYSKQNQLNLGKNSELCGGLIHPILILLFLAPQ